MKKALIAYVATLLTFLLLDGIWLGLLMAPTYRELLGSLMLEKPLLLPAAVFYCLYVIGCVVFVVLPALSWQRAAKLGALLGLVAYGTYDLTNWATLRGGGQLQTFGNEQKFQTKQRTGQQAAAPGAADLIPTALPADQQTDQQRRNPRAPRRLHHRRDVRCRPLDQDLLHTPDQAQADHHLQGKTVGIAPLGTHRNTSNTHNMAGHPMVRKQCRGLSISRAKKAVWKRH